MKIVCVGGGPAGLYFAILAKLRSNDHDVTVVERNSAGVTHGWGVVFSDKLFYNLYSNDFESAHEIRESSAHCNPTKIHIQGKLAGLLDSYTLSIARRRLLDILAKRAMELGVEIRFEHEAKDSSEFADADLIVACDGMNSRLRHLYTSHFQTNVDVGQNKYIWLGTHKVFDAFTFAFEETSAGWIWFHAYRFDNDTSTFIAECSPQTWKGLGFDELGPDESIALLEGIFESYLDDNPLIDQMSRFGKAAWLNFQRITNESWYHDNIVLMGDAAHTTHFTIGSGTELALEDAISLAKKLHKREDLQSALKAYEEERRFALRIPQIAAYNSARWFEHLQRHIDQDAEPFVSSLVNRMQPKNGRYSGFSGFSRLW